MAVALRLMRIGKKNRPFYRIVAVDKSKKRTGAYIEKVGHYDPLTKSNSITLNRERFEWWQIRGAQISDGLRKLMKNSAFKKG